jgi:cobyrinic acid a,c-diamide synthase
VFDGHSSLTEEGSTAQLAKLLGAPVILVADAAKVARSVAAEVLGFQKFDPDLNVVGVILNGVGSDRHLEFCKPQIEATTGLPVLGYLPRKDEFIQPERHLGLIPTVEGTVASKWYDSVINQVEATMDVPAILKLAQTAQTPAAAPGIYPNEPLPARTTIAVAQDMAFNFYYQDSLDLLTAWGAELVPFSPLEDSKLPAGVGGIYLGGGFPELFAAQLSENKPMHDAIRQSVGKGVRVYAECGGLMYLGKSLSDLEGVTHSMIGVIPAESAMSQTRLTMGYRDVESCVDSPVLPKGQQVRGHEFHWSTLAKQPEANESVYKVVNQDNRLDGFRTGNVWASYVHIHLGSLPGLASRFVETCAAAKK